MSSVRLFILGTLAEHGAMHGHQIRAQAQEDRTELWTDIRVGALYGALKRLSREGLIEATRSERAGGYPERTVYAITADGQRALRTVHDEALRSVVFPTDPFDLALAHSGGVAEETLSQVIGDRRASLATQESSMRHQLEAADPWLSEAERMVLEHLIRRLTGEVAWHDDLLNRLPKIVQDFAERQQDRS